jgi:hypothetical protein
MPQQYEQIFHVFILHKINTVKLGYSNIGFYDTLSIASNIQWYALIPHKAYSFITTLFLGPFDDVITKFYCILGSSRSHKRWGISWVAELLLVPQDGFWSMDFCLVQLIFLRQKVACRDSHTFTHSALLIIHDSGGEKLHK